MGQVSHKTDIAGRKTSYGYLPGGRLDKIYTSTGRETILSYDALGRLREREEKHRGKTTYDYDCMGRRKPLTYIVKRKEELLRETDKLEKELFKKQVFILQDYYQQDRPREKVKGTFAALFQKWDREEPAASLGIHYLFSGIQRNDGDVGSL